MKYVITSFVKSFNSSLAAYTSTLTGAPIQKQIWVTSTKLKRDSHRIENFLPPTHEKLTPDHPLWFSVENQTLLTDLPWCFLYKEIHSHFPDSKFLHGIRPSHEWLSSLKRYDALGENHIGNQQLWMFAGYPYNPPFEPFEWNSENEERLINTYETHNQSVIDYFKDFPENFICVETPIDGKDRINIANFLGSKEVPPFPHLIKNTHILPKIK